MARKKSSIRLSARSCVPCKHPRGSLLRFCAKRTCQAEIDGYRGTDDASLVERLGIAVQLTEGSEDNLKLTTPRDMIWAETLLEQRRTHHAPLMRVGQGYDVHRLVEGRRLVLCGRGGSSHAWLVRPQ